jgi:hypothetical protein
MVIFGYFSRQNATYMAYILPFFWLCVFPSGKWQPSHPVVQALPFFPANGHVLADAAALFAVTATVVKVFRPCAFLLWALVLTHFLPCSCGFLVPTSSRLLSDTVQALHYVALIDIPVILIYILASPRASFLSNTSFSHVWRLFKVPYRPHPTYFFTDVVVHPGLLCAQLCSSPLHRLPSRLFRNAADHYSRFRWCLQVGHARQIQLQRVFPRFC